MFSGIIGEIGKVKSITRKGASARLEVLCEKTKDGAELGDSVAVNGVCLSIVGLGACLAFDVVGNTLGSTNLKRLRTGDSVNLEKALKMGEDISGHMVTGHVDGERAVKGSRKTSKGWELEVATERGDERYIASKGSIAIDGVSLTVGEVTRCGLKAFLIPHTLENTILKRRKVGDRVNVEFDMMAKYALKRGGGITMDFLREKGFA